MAYYVQARIICKELERNTGRDDLCIPYLNSGEEKRREGGGEGGKREGGKGEEGVSTSSQQV